VCSLSPVKHYLWHHIYKNIRMHPPYLSQCSCYLFMHNILVKSHEILVKSEQTLRVTFEVVFQAFRSLLLLDEHVIMSLTNT